jgi:hypothetical protein
MGNRQVWGFKSHDEAPTIYLYAHWGKADPAVTLAAALDAARPRWNDADYATRICVSQIIGEDWSDALGYGLSVDTYAGPEYPVLVVNWQARTVTEEGGPTFDLDAFCAGVALVLQAV